MPDKKIGIIGATGYTGSELVRILKHHPEVEIEVITSESRAGERFSDVHPFFQGIADNELVKAGEAAEMDLDLVFLALPHGVSMGYARRFLEKGIKVVDLSGDFRLGSPETYETWYKKAHTFKEGFDQAVYGLPELFREEVKSASLVANPGCYPTTNILAVAPLIDAEAVDPSRIIADSKSGVTGAGAKAKATTHFSNANDNFKAYGLKKHRHTIEIQETLDKVAGGSTTIQFTPHLLPVDRGILTTVYAQPTMEVDDGKLNDIYRSFYKDEPFIRICDAAPAIKDVRASNYCNLFVTFDGRTNNIIVISVIDNLVKGAAGQAVQNMNIMFGYNEAAGLNQVPVNP